MKQSAKTQTRANRYMNKPISVKEIETIIDDLMIYKVPGLLC